MSIKAQNQTIYRGGGGYLINENLYEIAEKAEQSCGLALALVWEDDGKQKSIWIDYKWNLYNAPKHKNPKQQLIVATICDKE